jgi:hypothetical protein
MNLKVSNTVDVSPENIALSPSNLANCRQLTDTLHLLETLNIPCFRIIIAHFQGKHKNASHLAYIQYIVVELGAQH